ncbi:polypyrimidine tract-binding protein homolog 2 isoform X1 [Tanacetum coccineum]
MRPLAMYVPEPGRGSSVPIDLFTAFTLTQPNQKPQGSNGILKKLDRVMANVEFSNEFVGNYAVFQPYVLYDKGNLHDNVNKLRIEMARVQQDLDVDPTNQDLRDEEAVYVRAFTEALIMEERFLKQKAKIEWLKVGDSNSAYFHKSVKGRTSRNRIDVVTDLDGDLVTDDGVPAAFVSHYEAFLGQPGITSPFDSNNLFLNRLTSDQALDMIKHVTAQEVKEAIFSMGNDKSPGPDGYTACFFKECWDIVASDVVCAVQEFFTNGNLLKELNHTIIALIPKVNSPSQLMHIYHLDRGPSRCAFKVDIQKAYDTVDWGFLKEVLLAFGFHVRMVDWIMECVTTTSFSLSINGTLHGYFKGKRGLRQGDPLSLYLFTLIMEVLTLMLRRKVRDSDGFRYHRYCSDLEIINLCFADDLFIFAHGDPYSAKVIMEAMEEFKNAFQAYPSFKNAFGLTPSLPKSTAYFYNVLNHTKLSILQILPFEVPLVSSRLVFRDCKDCILLDIEQLMRGFLWCHGEMKKGRAKVAWEVVCLPKNEGGLGVRRLDLFNKAPMVPHIWNLITRKESLWVK